ncbi:hypothetical protein RCL1_003758 [Eukaryota sp. TZLM3-RCL]
MSDTYFQTIFELKFTCKRLDKLSQKAETASEQKRKLVTKYLAAKDPDVARIHAEDAIRKHRESIHYLQLSAQIDSVKGRLESANAVQLATKHLTKVSHSLKSLCSLTDLGQLNSTLQSLDKSLDKLGIHNALLDSSLSTVTGPINTASVDEFIASMNTEDLAALDNLPEVPSSISDHDTAPSIPSSSRVATLE